MAERTLDVWCFGDRAGTLTETATGLRFTYAEDWLHAGGPALSFSLPLSGAFADAAADAFFGGLLPEGTPRLTLARQLGISPENDFSLLEALAGDTAGAIVITPAGSAPPTPSDDVKWLDEGQLIEELDDLQVRPFHADENGEYRLSLAGAQDKLPVVMADDGRIGLTHGGTPSTHIIKAPIPTLDATVANELLQAGFQHRPVDLPQQPARDMHDTLRIDAHEIPVVCTGCPRRCGSRSRPCP